jgi:hypothetical protein
MTPDEFAAERENAGTRIKKAEPYGDYVVECLRKYPDMSSAQLYDWILEKHKGIELPLTTKSRPGKLKETKTLRLIPCNQPMTRT